MTSGLRRFFVFRNYLIIASIAIALLVFFAKHYAFFPFDLYITRAIQLINYPFFEQLMLFISWSGNVYQTIISIAVASLLFYIKGKKEFAVGVFASTIGVVAISESLKIIVGRPRPDPTLIHQIESFIRDDSFPSGHVLFAMGFYGFMLFAAFTLIKNKNLRRVVSGVVLAVIILMGVSRIYLGSHWFSDTLASYLIGSVWLYFVVLIFKKFEVQSLRNG